MDALDARRRIGTVHHAADADLADAMMQLVRIVGKAQGAEHLPRLFFDGHIPQGLFYPTDRFIIEAKRLCFQVDHKNTPFMMTGDPPTARKLRIML